MPDSAPRLLFLCHTLPHPPDGGVWIRSYHTLRQLTRAFDVRALCFERTGKSNHDVGDAVSRLSQVAPTEAFPVPQEGSTVRKLADHGASLFTGRPFTVYKHRSRSFRERLTEVLGTEDFDLVHVDSLDLSTHLPLILEDHPVACVHHNVESQLLERRAEAETNPLARWYLRIQARFQRREEERWCGRVDLNVTVSADDRDTLREIVPGAPVEVVPNGVDVEKFSPKAGTEEREELVFVGGAGWFPNRNGMEHFADEILPEIRSRTGREVPVTWVGGADEELKRRFRREHDVRMTGYVEDIRPQVRAAACYVVPLRVGGGSRLKILDAWAMGKAVVSTSRGCEGLDARDGENILIRDDPDAFAEAVCRVLEEESLRNRLGRSARKTAVETYSWEKIGGEMNRAYRSLIE